MIPLWWLPEPWASWFSAATTPAARAVEMQQTDGGDAAGSAAPASPPPTPSGRDFYAADNHNGSANLSECPASHEEMHMAGRLYEDPDDLDAARKLRQLAGSGDRAAAILAQVTRIIAAHDTLRRGFGGEPA